MFLQLRAHVAYANGAENVVHHVFDTQGGTIGRDAHCQMVLQDPFRRISRIQAQLVFEGTQFTLINASTSNPIYVDGQELSPGAACAVQADSCWRTGNYAITVEHLGHAPQTSSGPLPPSAVIERPPIPVGHQGTSVVMAIAPEGGQDPFADLLSQPVALPPDLAEPQASPCSPTVEHAPAPVAHPDEMSDPLASVQQMSAASAALPDPFSDVHKPIPEAPPMSHDTPALGADPFADLLAAPLSGQVAAAPSQIQHASMIPEDFNSLALNGISPRNTADPLGQMDSPESLGGIFAEQSIDASFQPSEGNISELTHDPLNGRQNQGLVDVSSNLDPLALFAKQSSEAMLNPAFIVQQHADQAPAVADHRVEMGAYFRAPRAYEPNAQQPAVQAETLSDIAAVQAPEPPTSGQSAPASLGEGLADGNSLESLFDISSSASSAETPSLLATSHSGGAPGENVPSDPPLQRYEVPHLTQAEGLPNVAEPPIADTPTASATAAVLSDGHAPSTPSKAHPEVPMPEPATIAPSEGAGASKQVHSAEELLLSFKAGAGLSDCRYPEKLTPELMHIIGSMLGASIQGCMDLLGSRAAAKQEVRVSVTLINAEANNPLKFLPTADSALAQIFGPRMPGFQAGPEAVVDAFQDLRSHEMAMMAGTQAAVRGLLDRFSPRHFEEQLQAQGRRKTLFPAQRQARLWELYCSHYAWLKEEMKNQSPTAWGSQFLSAYQAEASNHHEDHSK